MNNNFQQQKIDVQTKNTTQNQFETNDDGFSGEEQLEEEIVYQASEDWRDLMDSVDERVKMKIDPVQELPKKWHSLEPDMVTGWVPKNPLCKPIPLTFKNSNFDPLLDYYMKFSKKKQTQRVKLCYLGARYQTTYYAWYEKNFQFPYKHLNAPKYIQITDRFMCGQHWDAQGPQILAFDSLFEGGNLDAVFKVGEYQYDLYMRVDSNTHGHLQWFNFKVTQLRANQNYKFNICNYCKGKSLYSRGMAPYFYSAKKFKKNQIDWAQINSECKYRKKVSKTQKFLGYQSEQTSYVLTFLLQTQYQDDHIQLCYCIPYSYSFMKNKIDQLYEKYQHNDIIKIKKMCASLGGLELPEITITQDAALQQQLTNKKQRLPEKKIVFITGRAHPGESNGSWMVDGLLDFLCGNSQEAQFFRKNIIVKIIPMLNPDGVVMGNYRTGLSGKDFNREFLSPDKDIFPEIYHLKQLFRKYKKIYNEDMLIYLDFHGHSIKKNVFAYGPEYSIIHKNYYESRMIPKFIAAKTKMFRYHSCIFKISEHKQKTGRAICLKNIRIPFTFTIEASNGCYYSQQDLKNINFDAESWRKTGECVMKGVFEYLRALKELQILRISKMKERKQLLQNKSSRQKKRSSTYKAGIYTSVGFRKPKQTGKPNGEQIFLADFFKNVGATNKNNFSSLISQIRVDDQNQQQGRQSDDDISEGSSDSQRSDQDLNQEQSKHLFNNIKGVKNQPSIINKFKGKREVKVQHIKTMYNNIYEEEDMDVKNQKQKMMKRNSQKQSMFRKCLRKKNSTCTTPSPKKQEAASNGAKIVNFSFSLKPTDICVTASKPPLMKEKFGEYTDEKCRQRQSSMKQISSKRSAKPYQYSESFKKNFISVQKQILRRQNQKRYLVTLNNSLSQNKPKPSYLIENAKSKKVIEQVNE